MTLFALLDWAINFVVGYILGHLFFVVDFRVLYLEIPFYHNLGFLSAIYIYKTKNIFKININ